MITLLRHGRLLNSHRLMGKTDHSLDPTYFKDIYHVRDAMKQLHHEYDVVISSPLKRCTQTALLLGHNISSIEIVDGFAEMDLGIYESLPASTENLAKLKELELFPYDTSHHGESTADFVNRVERMFFKLETKYPHENILVITHSGVMRPIIYKILGLIDDFIPAYLGSFTISNQPRRFVSPEKQRAYI